MKLCSGRVFLQNRYNKTYEKHNNAPVGNILKSRPLSDREFKIISDKVYELSRINLHDGKKELVQARLNKRLRKLGFDTYKEYLHYVEQDATGEELINMVDVLTTNLTFFFREEDHFDFLTKNVLKPIDPDKDRKLRIWSAGCSSGEEPYTIAMLMREQIPNMHRMDALILATDISTRILNRAEQGIYNASAFRATPKGFRLKYFSRYPNRKGEQYKVNPDLTALVRFRQLNLMAQWPFQGKFNVVFCRNVMIYFDRATQKELVNKFYDAILPGGYFFVGHSESLSSIKHGFKYIKPAVYRKS